MGMLIHIGGNKTASTLLQRRLFATHPQISYLGEDCAGFAELQKFLDSLVADDDSHFDAARARGIFADRFGGAAPEATCVFSNEDIMTSLLPSVCAARLKELMPDARVVMVIRNQLTTWPSWYANHGAYLKQVPRRYWRSHVPLDDWLDYCFRFPRRTPVEAMNYDRYYDIFARHFGSDRIVVLLYEELLADPRAYYGRWADLLGITYESIEERISAYVERPRNSARRMAFDRWLSRTSGIPGLAVAQAFILSAFPTIRAWIDAGPPASIDLPEAWRERIADYYRSGNSRLAERTGLDLRHYGYPVR